MLAERSLEEDVRALLAAERRARLSAAGEWRVRGAAAAAARRGDEARQRREARLHDSSRVGRVMILEIVPNICTKILNAIARDGSRALIGNALSSWECSIMRHEIETLDAIKRASAATRLADAEERGKKVEKARHLRQSRARRAARAAELLRAAVIGYRR
ncbi:hypothetical protein EVAR_27455_1 [Eumeta japonica]|uniref:Uncharacterized protein n=1 Tax=Eumeta variegata TaxID=151549 RepID=A0A4C1VMV0_EUMVA|nr:hypothetical protein EVAR_27455_1 [Eumeta japonica]